ncbi:MAG: hypothetical protein NE327_12435, partial [Lentisphaeraceae bacterium]|nr:hypothetical protein [Lentisphaeraceae bacterium]
MSWTDIEDIGALEEGFILDITFLNTYRNAFYEKFNFINIGLNLPAEIDPTKGFILTRAYALQFFGVMRHLILNVQWIKEIRFNNPQDYGALDDDTDDVWQDYEIEAHIGSYSYDILTDSSLGAYKMEDLFGATLWNAVYKLYKDVFVYIESNMIKSSFMSWEQYGTASSPLLTEDCSPGSGTGCLVTPLNDYCTDQEELEATLLDSGSGRETIRV